MRNTAETTDGFETLKLITVAAALLIPPICMLVAAPEQRVASVAASETGRPEQAVQRSSKPTVPAVGATQLLPSSLTQIAPQQTIKVLETAKVIHASTDSQHIKIR